MKYYNDQGQEWVNLPVCKSGMVYWLKQYYPEDERKFCRMSNKRLKAIILSVIKRNRAGVPTGLNRAGGSPCPGPEARREDSMPLSPRA